MSVVFLYYLPHQTEKPTAAEIERRGLSHALAGESLTTREVTRGPDSLAGMIVAVGDPANPIGYYPDSQQWRKVNELAWIGESIGFEKPGPKDLARSSMVAGHPIVDADGRTWIAPKARAFGLVGGELAGGCTLPCTLKRGEDGKWSPGDVLPRFSELWRIAEAWWTARFATEAHEAAGGGATISFAFEDAPNSAVACLSVNYRIGPVEADILGLFTTESCIAVLDAASDWPGLQEILKKKAASDR